jgi:hypothetical protein
MLTYRELFLRVEPMRSALQKVVDALRAQRPGSRVTGAELHAFLESDPEHVDALAYLRKLARLFRQVEHLNPTERESDETRLDLLERIALTGIQLEELNGAVRATAGEPSLS